MTKARHEWTAILVTAEAAEKSCRGISNAHKLTAFLLFCFPLKMLDCQLLIPAPGWTSTGRYIHAGLQETDRGLLHSQSPVPCSACNLGGIAVFFAGRPAPFQSPSECRQDNVIDYTATLQGEP